MQFEKHRSRGGGWGCCLQRRRLLASCQVLWALGTPGEASCLVGLAGFSLPDVHKCNSNYSTKPGARQAQLLGNNAADRKKTSSLLIIQTSALFHGFCLTLCNPGLARFK